MLEETLAQSKCSPVAELFLQGDFLDEKNKLLHLAVFLVEFFFVILFILIERLQLVNVRFKLCHERLVHALERRRPALGLRHWLGRYLTEDHHRRLVVLIRVGAFLSSLFKLLLDIRDGLDHVSLELLDAPAQQALSHTDGNKAHVVKV